MRIPTLALLGLVTCSAGWLGPCHEPSGREEPAPESRLFWLVLRSPSNGGARFLTLDGSGDAVAVDAADSNLETATLARVRQGRLERALVEDLFEALHQTDWKAVHSTPVDEPIEERRPLVDLGVDSDALTIRRDQLDLSGLPERLSRDLQRALSASESLPAAPEGIVLQALVVDARRAERIRSDPRRVYSFRRIRTSDLAALPTLERTIRHPGAVLLALPSESARLDALGRESNPRRLGDTCFVELAEDGAASELQIHLKRWPPPPPSPAAP